MAPQPAECKLTAVREMAPDRAIARLRLAVMVAHDIAVYALQSHGQRSKQYREAVREENKASRRLDNYKRLCGME